MGLMLGGHPKDRDAGFVALSSSTIRFAWSFRAPKAGNLTRAGFRFTAAVTPQTMKASWQNPQATSLRPDETVDQFRTFTPAVGWITTGLITSDGTDTGALRTVTKGERVCLVIEWNSTTGSVQLQPYGNANEHWKPAVYNFTRNSGGVWSTSAALATANIAIQYDDGAWAYLDGALPCSNDGTHTFNSGSATDEIGIRFLAPFTGAIVKGVHLRMNTSAAFDIKLYDASDVVLASTTFPSSSNRSLGSASQSYFELPEVSLTGGAVYRITFLPTSGSNIDLPYADVSTNAFLGGWPGGIDCYQTARVNGGAWTDTTTRRPNINLLWSDDIPEPVVPATPSEAPVAIVEMCFGVAPSGKPGYRNWIKEHPSVVAHWYLSDVPVVTAEDEIFPNDAGVYGGGAVKGRGMLPDWGMSTQFDGVDDHVEVDYDSLGLGLDDPFTFVAVCSPDAVTGSVRCIHQSGTTGGYLAIDATGHFKFGKNGGSVVTLSQAVEAGGEYLVVGRFDGTDARLVAYSLHLERTDDERKLGRLLGSAGPTAFSIGPHGASDAFIGQRASENFGGRIQGVACFDASLSDGDVDELLECCTWTDVSGDCRAIVPIECGFGLFDDSPTARVAPTGVCTFGLDNSHDNEGGLEGWYSLDHANCRPGFTRGIPVRVSIGSEALGSSRRFLGALREIKPTTGRHNDRVTHCAAADWMEEAAHFNLRGIETQQSVTADEVIELILYRMENKPHAMDLDVGSDVYPIALDNTKDENAYAQSEFDRLMMSEMGLLYVAGDGTLRFENRTARSSLLTVLATYDDAMSTAEADASAKQIINYVRAVVNPRRVDAAATTQLYVSSNRIAIDGGSTTTFLQFRDPDQESARFGGIEVVSPAPTTHYTLNTQDDGLGADVTANPNITASFEISGSGVYMTVVNNYGQRVFMQIEVLGKGVRSFEPITIIEKDDDSIKAVGQNEAVLQMPYQTSVPTGQGAAQQVLSINATTQTRMKSIVLPAHKDAAYLAAAVETMIADRVAVRETISGVDGEFFVTGVKLSWQQDKQIMLTLFLTPADTQEYWLLDSSALDSNTRLGFA